MDIKTIGVEEWLNVWEKSAWTFSSCPPPSSPAAAAARAA